MNATLRAFSELGRLFMSTVTGLPHERRFHPWRMDGAHGKRLVRLLSGDRLAGRQLCLGVGSCRRRYSKASDRLRRPLRCSHPVTA